MTGKRERNKAANRAEILAAGRACFIEKGFEAVTVRDIIRRTSLATGTFYNYYPDKYSVYHDLLEQRMQSLTDRLIQIRRTATSLHDWIYGAYLATFETIAEDPLFYEVILRNMAVLRDYYEDSVMGITVAALESDIHDGIQRGLFPDLDVEYLAAAFFGVGFEIGRTLAKREKRDPKPAAELAAQLFLHGIQGAGQSHAPRAGALA